MSDLDTVGGGGADDEPCEICGATHAPGEKRGDPVPDDTKLRRGVGEKSIDGDGNMTKSAFDDQRMSVDLASKRSVEQTMAQNHLKGGGSVEFTAGEAREAFPDNEVVFDCIEGNPHHVEVRGKKTKGKRNQFVKKTQSRFKK